MLGTTIYVGYYKLWVVTVMYVGQYNHGEYYNLGGTATYYKLWVVTVMYAGYYTLWCVLQFRQGMYVGCYNLVGTTYCKLLYRVAIT